MSLYSFQPVLGPLRSSTHSVHLCSAELNIPSLFNSAELNAWVVLSIVCWVVNWVLLRHSVQLSWTERVYSTQLNWVELNAWVWVYTHIRPKTGIKTWAVLVFLQRTARRGGSSVNYTSIWVRKGGCEPKKWPNKVVKQKVTKSRMKLTIGWR